MTRALVTAAAVLIVVAPAAAAATAFVIRLNLNPRSFLRRALGGLMAVGIAAVATSVGASAGSGVVALPYHTNFSRGCAPWPVGSDGEASVRCVRGAYRVHVIRPINDEYVRIAAARSVARMIISADVWTQSAGRDDASGIGCWTSPRTGYIFSLSVAGRSFSLERVVLGGRHSGSYTELKKTYVGRPPLRRVSLVQVACRLDRHGVGTFDLWINGVHAADARDPHAFGRFSLFGIQVAPFRRGADFLFDNLLVEAP